MADIALVRSHSNRLFLLLGLKPLIQELQKPAQVHCEARDTGDPKGTAKPEQASFTGPSALSQLLSRTAGRLMGVCKNVIGDG